MPDHTDLDLDQARCERALTTRWLGRRLVVLPSTGSTNDVLRDLALVGAREGTVVVADVQQTGRGRLGRRWVAPAGTCLLCSLLFRPAALPPADGAQVTMLAALAAADAVQRLAGLRIALKWPNDLLVPQATADAARPWRKLAGLLTETTLTGNRLDTVVVGIGMNVNVRAEDLPALAPDATSILAETGRRLDRAELLAALLLQIERRYEAPRGGQSPFAEWAERLAGMGQPVQALTEGGPLSGVAEGVDPDGALRLRTPDGGLHRLLATDVTLAAAAAAEGTLER